MLKQRHGRGLFSYQLRSPNEVTPSRILRMSRMARFKSFWTALYVIRWGGSKCDPLLYQWNAGGRREWHASSPYSFFTSLWSTYSRWQDLTSTSLHLHCFKSDVDSLKIKDYLINLATKAELKTAQNRLCWTWIKCEKRPYLTPEVGD